MTRTVPLPRARNPLPRGTVAVGAGLALTTIASYAFLILSARILGPTEYGLLAVFWSLVYIASGVFSPLEQEVSRALSARHASGLGGAPVVRRAAMLGVATASGVGAFVLVAAVLLGEAMLRGDVPLVACLMLALVGHSAARLLGGVLSGTGRFGRYGMYLSIDSLIRLLLGVVFVLVGVTASWPYGLALAVAPLLAIVPAMWRIGVLTGPGPEAPWRELSVALGVLLASSVLASALLYAPAVLIEALAGPEARSEAGVFNAALVLTRLPLVLFAAVQITLLPQLSSLVAGGRVAEIPYVLRRPLVAILAVLAAGCVAAFAIGPAVMEIVYGSGYQVESDTIGVLTVGTSAYVVAITLSQGLIALRVVSRAAWSWAAGLAAMVITLAVVNRDVVTRVEMAYVAGAAAAALMMGILLLVSLRSDGRAMERTPTPDAGTPPLA